MARNINNLLINPHTPPPFSPHGNAPPQTATLMEELSLMLRSPSTAPYSNAPQTPHPTTQLPPLSATFQLQRATTFPARPPPVQLKCKRCQSVLTLPPSIAVMSSRPENRTPPLALTVIPRNAPRCKPCDINSTQALCRTISSAAQHVDAIKKIKTDMEKMEQYKSQGVMVREMEASLVEAKKRLEHEERKKVERMNKAWGVFAGVWGREDARGCMAKGGLMGMETSVSVAQ